MRFWYLTLAHVVVPLFKQTASCQHRTNSIAVSAMDPEQKKKCSELLEHFIRLDSTGASFYCCPYRDSALLTVLIFPLP